MESKSDKKAKEAFVKKLLKKGYDNAEIKSSPADIVAYKDGYEWFFEIKKTTKEECFGAATQTEWKQAFKDPEHFLFVIAKTDEKESDFDFEIITPEEFMEYSTISPFKVNFNINWADLKNRSNAKKKRKKNCKSLRLTKDTFMELDEFFEKLKKEKKS